MSEWFDDTPKKEISVDEMDKLCAEYKAARDEYDQASSIAKDKKAAKDSIEFKIIEMLKDAGKTSWEMDGFKISRSERFSVATPKTFEDKKKVFDHFKALGEDFFFTYVGVNSQSLNSYYRKALEEDPSFNIEGCGMPTVSDIVSLRKK